MPSRELLKQGGILIVFAAIIILVVLSRNGDIDGGELVTSPAPIVSSPDKFAGPGQNNKPMVVNPPEPALLIGESDQPVVAENLVIQKGRIKNESGSGLTGIEVEIESLGFDGEKITSHSATSNQRGEYLFEELIAGRQYKLEIKPGGEYAGYSLDTFTAGDAATLKEIVLDRVKLVNVDGMIVDTDNNPVADFELGVRNLSVTFPDRSIRSDSSGYFNLKDFPAGELRIATNASDYYRIKGLILQPDEYRNLTLVLDRGNHHLSGWVSDENGAPLPEAQVTLKSSFAGDGYHSFSYRSRITDENGNFEFTQLGGHRITLGVYAEGFKTHIQQHNFQSFSDTLVIKLKR